MGNPASGKALQTILGLLGTLEENDLKKLSFALSQKLGGKPLSAETATTDVTSKDNKNLDAFYRAIVHRLPDECVWPVSVNILRKSSKSTYTFVSAAFGRVDTVADELIKASKLNVSKQVLRLKIYNLYADVVCSWLSEHDIAVSLKQVLSQSNRFIALLDDSFPGYVGSGNIDLILSANQIQ